MEKEQAAIKRGGGKYASKKKKHAHINIELILMKQKKQQREQIANPKLNYDIDRLFNRLREARGLTPVNVRLKSKC